MLIGLDSLSLVRYLPDTMNIPPVTPHTCAITVLEEHTLLFHPLAFSTCPHDFVTFHLGGGGG